MAPVIVRTVPSYHRKLRFTDVRSINIPFCQSAPSAFRHLDDDAPHTLLTIRCYCYGCLWLPKSVFHFKSIVGVWAGNQCRYRSWIRKASGHKGKKSPRRHDRMVHVCFSLIGGDKFVDRKQIEEGTFRSSWASTMAQQLLTISNASFSFFLLSSILHSIMFVIRPSVPSMIRP